MPRRLHTIARLMTAFVCLIFAPALLAQGGGGANVPLREIESEKWNRALDGIDYSGDVPAPPKPIKPKKERQASDWPDWDFDGDFWKGFFQVLAIILLIGLLGYAVYQMAQQPANRRIASDGVEITIENLETYIHETDLDHFLKTALDGRDYNQAVRVYFLKVIKQLTTEEAITWSREKTNREYLRQMNAHPMSAQFRQCTRIYERVWYGNQTLDPDSFSRIERQFLQFLGRA